MPHSRRGQPREVCVKQMSWTVMDSQSWRKETKDITESPEDLGLDDSRWIKVAKNTVWVSKRDGRVVRKERKQYWPVEEKSRVELVDTNGLIYVR